MPGVHQIVNVITSLVIPVVVLLSFVMLNAAYLSYMERKVLAHT